MTTFVETKITETLVAVLNTDTGVSYTFLIEGDPRGEFSLAPTKETIAADAFDPAHDEDVTEAQAFAEAILKKMA